VAYTQVSAQNAWYEDQSLTGTPPTTSATDGVSLSGLKALSVVVEAEATRTLSGGGTLQAYMYDSSVAAWYRVPELDCTVSSSGVRRAAYNFVIEATRSSARIAFVPDSVTVSAGTTVRVHILGAV
jgi:hypothetical protein